MSTILFVTWPGGGNQPPAFGLAQQLRARGHEIVIAGYAGQADRVHALGFAFEMLRRSGMSMERFDRADLMTSLTEHVWACPDHLADTRDLVARVRPELVVVDCLMGGVLAATEALPVASAALVHSAPGALAPPAGTLDSTVMRRLNAVRARASLDSVDSLWGAWNRHWVLCTSIPQLDPIAQQVPADFCWVGPIRHQEPEGSEKLPISADRARVLVSFSSGSAWDQTSRLQRSIDGLACAGLSAIVTSGAVDPYALHVPAACTSSATITLMPYAAHDEVLPHVAAVVTHAGHGTLTAALSYGLPVVAIPNLAADQPALAAQAARSGFGIHLDDQTATPSTIADAVQTVMSEPGFADRAVAIAEEIHTYAGRAVDVIDHAL